MKEMDKETAQYITTYFSHLLSVREQMAITHTTSTLKLNFNNSGNNVKLTRIYKQKGWITEDETVLDLLKEEGYESFEMKVAERIMNDHAEKVFLNNCPKCGRLARTAFAKQCRHCGSDWH